MRLLQMTIDFEDPTFKYLPTGRYIDMTYRILDLFDANNIKATFFTVGRIALAGPTLLREIAARGHEIAYHGHKHFALTEESPKKFYDNAVSDKDRLEQLTGAPVVGFRAPYYSLTSRTLWAVDSLKRIGFKYSASVMPTNISRFGIKEIPTTPFLWPCGLLEFPMPVRTFGRFKIPYLGGVYLYMIPFYFVQKWISTASKNEILWSYAHPYDFDRNEKFYRMPLTPLWMNIILRLARYKVMGQIQRLFEITDRSLPLRYLASDRSYIENLPTYTCFNIR